MRYSAFGGHVGGAVVLVEPGHPVAGALHHLHVGNGGLDPRQLLEQAFLLAPERGERLVLRGGVGVGVVIVEHGGRARTPRPGPALDLVFQLARGGLVLFGGGGVGAHVVRHGHGRAGREQLARLVDVRAVQGDAALGLARDDVVPLAVDPDAGAGLAAQLVHGVGVVQGVGDAAVHLHVQPGGQLVDHEVDAFGGLQVAGGLLVAHGLPGGADVAGGQLERAVAFVDVQLLVFLVHGHQAARRAGIVRDAHAPAVGGGGKGTEKGKQQGSGGQQAVEGADGASMHLGARAVRPVRGRGDPSGRRISCLCPPWNDRWPPWWRGAGGGWPPGPFAVSAGTAGGSGRKIRLGAGGFHQFLAGEDGDQVVPRVLDGLAAAFLAVEHGAHGHDAQTCGLHPLASL